MDNMMPAVMISTQPKYCEMIVNRKKTIELRKTYPKRYPVPLKCYIYCTLPPAEELFTHGHIREYANELLRLQSGEVVYDYGMRLCVDPEDRPYSDDNFLCRKVIAEFICDQIVAVKGSFLGHPVFYTKAIEDACLTKEQVEAYCGEKIGAGWHITQLKVYDKPKALSEFGLTRPPQSWCYVKEVKDAFT